MMFKVRSQRPLKKQQQQQQRSVAEVSKRVRLLASKACVVGHTTRNQVVPQGRCPLRFLGIIWNVIIIILTRLDQSSGFLFARNCRQYVNNDSILYRCALRCPSCRVTPFILSVSPLSDELPDQDESSALVPASIHQTIPTAGTQERALGLLSLLTVPIIWGTYVPTVRFMYEVDPPVPGLVFSASYLSVAALASLVAIVIEARRSESGARTNFGSDGLTTAAKAGLELGLYTFLANTLQVVGLETVPSDRAGFLIQLTTIMVPILQATMDWEVKAVPRSTWIACVVALAGVAIMGLDTSAASMQSWQIDFTRGDLFIVGAAMLYTMHVVRLGHWACQANSLLLASAKAIVQSILSLSLVAFLCSTALGPSLRGDTSGIAAILQQRGDEILSFAASFGAKQQTGHLPLLSLGRVIAAVMWSGVVGTAYVLYAQSLGQRYVKPSDANLIYSLQPIFTALFAYVLLGETMEAQGFVGGVLILGSVFYSVSSTVAIDQRDRIDLRSE